MPIKIYNRKSSTVEAIQVTQENLQSIWEWMGDSYTSHQDDPEDGYICVDYIDDNGKEQEAERGSFIMKGPSGFYHTSEENFKKIYEV